MKMAQKTDGPREETNRDDYRLDDQVGFILRRANQRHLNIFSRNIDQLTPTQFAAIAKLSEVGTISQNALGRLTAMDGATIKGVVDRMTKRGLMTTVKDQNDRRRTIVDLTPMGRDIFSEVAACALTISDETLAPLNQRERATFLKLLKKLT